MSRLDERKRRSGDGNEDGEQGESTRDKGDTSRMKNTATSDKIQGESEEKKRRRADPRGAQDETLQN